MDSANASVVSIDLGSDRIMAFFWDSAAGKARPIVTSKHPTLFALRHIILIGREAEKERRPNATNVCDEVVSLLGEGGGNVSLRYQTDTRNFTAEVCLALLLSKLRDSLRSEPKAICLTQCAKVVFCIPAAFRIRAKLLVKKAAAIAGIKNAVIAPSPTCAALYYYDYFLKSTSRPSQIQRLAVIDVGACFMSAADVTVSFDPPRVVVSVCNGISFGGRDLDAHVQALAPSGSLQECEKCKKELSHNTVAYVHVPSSVTQHRVLVKRSEFEEKVEKTFQEKGVPLLQSVFPSRDTVDVILMVGGSSRIPSLAKAVKNFFPNTAKQEALDMDYGCGIGAALIGVSWLGKNPLLNFQDMSTTTVPDLQGVSWEDGVGYVTVPPSASDSITLHQRDSCEVVGHVLRVSSDPLLMKLTTDREGLLTGETYTAPKELVDQTDIVASRVVVLSELAKVKQYAEVNAARNELEGRVLHNCMALTGEGAPLYLDRLGACMPFVQQVLKSDTSTAEVMVTLARCLQTVHSYVESNGPSSREETEAALDRIEALQNLSITTTSTTTITTARPVTVGVVVPQPKSHDVIKATPLLSFHKIPAPSLPQTQISTPIPVPAPNVSTAFTRSQSAPIHRQAPLTKPTPSASTIMARVSGMPSASDATLPRRSNTPNSSTKRGGVPHITIANSNIPTSPMKTTSSRRTVSPGSSTVLLYHRSHSGSTANVPRKAEVGIAKVPQRRVPTRPTTQQPSSQVRTSTPPNTQKPISLNSSMTRMAHWGQTKTHGDTQRPMSSLNNRGTLSQPAVTRASTIQLQQQRVGQPTGNAPAKAKPQEKAKQKLNY